jgi:Gpi18-like mannosyltransferase/predicted membrane-bound dolichyl-phosphate-mannose-protein mannosyltransferase
MEGFLKRIKFGMTTVLCMLAVIISLTAATTQMANAATNLLDNSSFEELNSNIPALWSTAGFETDSSFTKFSIGTTGAHSGSSFAVIENIQANDARWVQKIKVSPKTLYKLSGWAMVENVGVNAKGANVTVEGITESSQDLKETNHQWQLLEMYIKTGADQEELAFTARLGGYGSANTGKASFDDMAVEQVEAAPNGSNVIQLGQAYKQAVKNTPAAKDTEISYTRMIWWSILFVGLFIFIYRLMIQKQFLNYSLSETKFFMGFLLCAAAFIRLLIAPSMVGFSSDVYSFMSWSQDAATNGLTHFYGRPDFLADYPPGYMFVLYILGKLSQAFGMDYLSDASLILYKMPAMLADLVCTYLIYHSAKKVLPGTAAIGLAALYAFNPAILLNSAAWGQVDSFFTLFVLIAVMALVNGKIPLATALFALAVLIKPQALMFGPLLLFVFIRIRKDWKTILISIVSGLLVLLIVPLPFTINQVHGPLYLIDLYTSTLGSYTYASLNAYNLIALTGGNWQSVTNKILYISYANWSYILILASLIYCGVLYFKSKTDETKLYWIAFFFMTAVFMVTVKMHERYLFYALVFGLMSFIHLKDRRILYIFFSLSLTHFINTDEILAYNLVKQFNPNQYGAILVYTSLANTIIFIYMIKVGWDILVRGKLIRSHAESLKIDSNRIGAPAMRLTREVEPEIKLKKLDYRLIAILTLVYALFALINLGSFKAPESYWQPANAGESLYAHLGSTQDIKKVNSFGGPGDGSFKIEFSNDLKAWHDAATIERKGGDVFAWKSLGVSVSAKYVKVTSVNPGFRLNEIALYGDDPKKPLHVEIVVPGTKSQLTKGKPSLVFDEPDQAAYQANYMNSTYFDEIYHARTAYEHMHSIEPYESTHPPLGKIFIGFGTAIFGMNPFGWRIMGTLFGIAMIPIFYAFGKQLFRKTEYAFMGAFLLAFDFMHFVQTRISTIDVYGVFFIILMYYYMYRYYRLSFYNTPLKATLKPLALSALFFGLGAASKWIAIYAGAGLAILLVLVLFERYREYLEAKRLLVTKHVVKKEDAAQSYYRHIIETFQPSLVKTLAWCLLFFLAVPGVIYVLSYLPFMLVPGPGHGLYDVFTYQKHIYDYHKNLVATHPFSSTWWQWPIMEKPLWYYGGQVAAGKTSLIVALGNPAVWWVGIPAIISTLWIGVRKKDKRVLFLFIAMCANYVPWMLVARLTFIYHFFAMLPFLIFCIVYVIRHLKEKYPSGFMNKIIYGYYAAVFLLFLVFYPILSGVIVNRSYVTHFLTWFKSWIF